MEENNERIKNGREDMKNRKTPKRYGFMGKTGEEKKEMKKMRRRRRQGRKRKNRVTKKGKF